MVYCGALEIKNLSPQRPKGRRIREEQVDNEDYGALRPFPGRCELVRAGKASIWS